MDERHVVVDSEGLDAGDGGVRDRELGPRMYSDVRARCEGQKMVVLLCVASRQEGDGTKQMRERGVGWFAVFKHLDVGSKLQTEFVVVESGSAEYNVAWTESFGNAILPRKAVEAANGIRNHAVDEDARKVFVGETVHT